MERRNPAIRNFFDNMESKVGMIKPAISLQDLRRRIYAKTKTDSAGKGGVTIGESTSGTIGHIKLGKKRIGKRSAICGAGSYVAFRRKNMVDGHWGILERHISKWL